jgi:hypothetical protein
MLSPSPVEEALDVGDGSESRCRAIGNGRVHLNLSVERQHRASAGVEQWIVLQDLDSSLHSVQRGSTACKNITSSKDSPPDSGNDSLFLVVGYYSDPAMNDDRVHSASRLNMLPYLPSIWYTQ